MTVVIRAVSVSGPLECYAADFAAERARQGYTPLTIRTHLHLVAHVSRWLDAEGLDLAALNPAAVEAFVCSRLAAGSTVCVSPKQLAPLLSYLQARGAVPVPPPPVPQGALDTLLRSYRIYLTAERGLAPVTVTRYVAVARSFLAERSAAGALDLQQLTASDVSAYVVQACRRRLGGPPVRMTALRSLLRYLHVQGLICWPLTGAVPAIASSPPARLPRALEPSQVGALLASCDRRTTVGRRDFAIITLLSRLGLRSGEVAALRLQDIDWHAGEILVRGKASRHERLPLLADVGEAVAAYLRRGRPSRAQGDCVFIRARAPHRGLGPTGVASAVRSASSRAGLGSVGPHRLRHTVATEMLRNGASLTEIGQVLRHRRLQSTAIYAKVDHEALRSVARTWIEPAA
jgi:site-specific recombinase XerD